MGRVLVPPLLVFSLVVAGMAGLSLARGDWDSLKPDACRLKDCFCEPFQKSLVLQPVNTYSNLGLVLAGLVLAWTGAQAKFPSPFVQHANRMSTRRLCPTLYGMTLAAAGLGSSFYHASLSRAGEWTDLVGIYLFLGFLLFYNLSRLARLSHGVLAGFYSVTMLVLGMQMIVAPELQHIVFGWLAAEALGLELLVHITRRPKFQSRYLAAALGCFAAGGALWALNGRLLPCDPRLPIPWHAVWHLLAAAAGVYLYAYYLSEKEG